MIKTYTITVICIKLLFYDLYAQSNTGFASVSDLQPVQIAANTADKPQSKLWKHDGKWWAVLPAEDGVFVWMLDNNSWVKKLRIYDSDYAKADCKVVGDVVHILLFRGPYRSYLTSIEYDAASGTYKYWTNRNSTVTLELEEEAETATIDIDGAGRMWLASDGAKMVNVRWSDPPYAAWSEPITLASNIKDDDICTVTAMSGKVGVMWSDQNSKRFGFRTHTNGAAPDNWGDDEVPASQSALDIGLGMADDHLNTALAQDGTLYCAVKTGYDKVGSPRVALLVRRPNGSWDNLYKVTDTDGTRPVVVLNENASVIRVIYTSHENGGDILYKESLLSKIAFCTPMPLFTGKYNYVTSTKEPYDGEIALMATNEGVAPLQAVSVILKDNQEIIAKGAQPCGNPEYMVVYPNPFSKRATLSFMLPISGKFTANLFDSSGAKVGQTLEGMVEEGTSHEFEIDGKDLRSGLYILRLQTQNEIYSLKVVVNN